jgi:hypothetical protein
MADVRTIRSGAALLYSSKTNIQSGVEPPHSKKCVSDAADGEEGFQVG